MKVLVCDGCYKVSPNWHYANPYNSSKFCDLCGTYCSEYDLEDDEIRRFEEKHEDYLKK